MSRGPEHRIPFQLVVSCASFAAAVLLAVFSPIGELPLSRVMGAMLCGMGVVFGLLYMLVAFMLYLDRHEYLRAQTESLLTVLYELRCCAFAVLLGVLSITDSEKAFVAVSSIIALSFLALYGFRMVLYTHGESGTRFQMLLGISLNVLGAVTAPSTFSEDRKSTRLNSSH